MESIVKKLDNTDKSGIINMLLKPISILLSIVYTPLLLDYLGTEKYGLWSTILAIISWVNFCDVGIGHGLRNLLTRRLSEKDYENSQKAVSTSYVMLSCISGVILVILISLVWILDWKKVFNTAIDLRAPLVISFAFICINFVLALINTLSYALQLSERVALRGCIVQIINVFGIVFLRKTSNENMILIAVLFGISSMIVHIGNTIQILKKYRYLSPFPIRLDKSTIGSICGSGLKFFIIQIACLLLHTVDNLIITYYFGSIEVTPFNIMYKVFSTAMSFLQALIIPYWARTTLAIEKKDINWLKKSTKKLNIICIFFCTGYIVLALIFKPIARMWIGYDLNYQQGLIVVMTIYYISYSFVSVNTQFINGTGKINGQVVIMVIMGIVNVPLSIYLAVTCGMGVVGVKIATTILMVIACVFFPVNLKLIMKSYEKEFKELKSD